MTGQAVPAVTHAEYLFCEKLTDSHRATNHSHNCEALSNCCALAGPRPALPRLPAAGHACPAHGRRSALGGSRHSPRASIGRPLPRRQAFAAPTGRLSAVPRARACVDATASSLHSFPPMSLVRADSDPHDRRRMLVTVRLATRAGIQTATPPARRALPRPLPARPPLRSFKLSGPAGSVPAGPGAGMPPTDTDRPACRSGWSH